MSILKKSPKLTAIAMAACLSCGVAQADDAFNTEFLDISQQELLNAAMPELNQQADAQLKAAGVQMKCFVDTPAWDVYTGPWCGSGGSSYNTTAAFKVFNLPPNTQVVWNTGGCPAYQPDLCLLPISINQAVSASANIVNNITGQVVATVSANARYFGNF